MKKEEALTQIRLNLKKLLRFADISKFNNFTLSDGTNITTTSGDIEEGAEVYQLDADGNQTPLDNGDYVLQDGRTFTIKDNLVLSIALPADDGTEIDSGGSETNGVEMNADGLPEGHNGDKQDPKDQPGMDDQESGDLSARVESLEKTVAELLNLVNQMGPAQNEIAETMMSALTKLGHKPSSKSIKPVKQGFTSYNVETKKEQDSQAALERLRSIRKEIISKDNNRRIF